MRHCGVRPQLMAEAPQGAWAQPPPTTAPSPSWSCLALWPAASANLTVISRLPARQSACTECLSNTRCDKEFVEESFKKALQGREKDTSTKLTAELERASSGKKGDSLSAFLSLLIKLLREQQEVKVSKEEQDANQWKNESFKAKRREAKGEQEAQRKSSELTTELPEYGHNGKLGKLGVAIPVIIGAITFIVIFCFIAIYCHRASPKDSKEGSSRGLFSTFRPTRCSPEHTIKKDVSPERQPLWLQDLYRPRSARCVEDMAQKLHDKDSSAEDELYYQM